MWLGYSYRSLIPEAYVGPSKVVLSLILLGIALLILTIVFTLKGSLAGVITGSIVIGFHYTLGSSIKRMYLFSRYGAGLWLLILSIVLFSIAPS